MPHSVGSLTCVASASDDADSRKKDAQRWISNWCDPPDPVNSHAAGPEEPCAATILHVVLEPIRHSRPCCQCLDTPTALMQLRRARNSNNLPSVSAPASSIDGVPPAKAPESGSSDAVKEYLQMWTGLAILYAADFFSKQVSLLFAPLSACTARPMLLYFSITKQFIM